MLAARTAVHPDLAQALRDCRRAFASVVLGRRKSADARRPAVHVAGYDRVLNSRSVPTLVALSLLSVGAYAVQGALDPIRSRVVVRSATLLDQRLALAVHGAVIRLAIALPQRGEAPQPVRDLDQIRAFLTGAGPCFSR
jgi:ATP-binding cassette, subfamily C, type I secretion system permease/ATPase